MPSVKPILELTTDEWPLKKVLVKIAHAAAVSCNMASQVAAAFHYAAKGTEQFSR